MSESDPTVSEHADALISRGRIGEAHRLACAAAEKADADALFLLANWRLAGRIVRRDLAAARELFRRAAEAGHAGAAEIYTAFVGNGTGGAQDWPAALDLLRRFPSPNASRQLSLLEAMRLSPVGEPLDLPSEDRLSDHPYVSCFPALFSEAECDFLIDRAQPWLAPSFVTDRRTGRQQRDPVRTSDGMSFTLPLESPVIHALNRRIAAATGTHAAQAETLHMMRYRPGQEFRPHLDAVSGDANQRILTVLVYLNEGYEGGETLFLRTGLRFRGKCGDALVFRTITPDGRPEELAEHAGLPVIAGEKFIASRWIRAERFAFPPPRPLLDA